MTLIVVVWAGATSDAKSNELLCDNTGTKTKTDSAEAAKIIGNTTFKFKIRNFANFW
jgi:hypothetical protein